MTSDDTSVSTDHGAVVHAVRSSLERPERAAAAGHVDALASSDLPAPTKLALLAHLKTQGVDRQQLEQLATSLVRDDLPGEQRAKVASKLVDRVVEAPGRDPLGRNGLDADPATAELMGDLVPAIATSALSVLPSCDARRVDVSGQPVLFVKTEMWSTADLADFEPVVDPLEWPNCVVQSHFFKDMTPQTPKTALLAPDAGWRATIRETVDFGFGAGEMVTDLEFVFHSNANSMGCTYSMAPKGSQDGKILHDEGYLLVQDLGKSRNARRITTLKAVWFSGANTPVDEVCPVWSLAAGLVAHSCLQKSA
jgi:hypothetical protein